MKRLPPEVIRQVESDLKALRGLLRECARCHGEERRLTDDCPVCAPVYARIKSLQGKYDKYQDLTLFVKETGE